MSCAISCTIAPAYTPAPSSRLRSWKGPIFHQSETASPSRSFELPGRIRSDPTTGYFRIFAQQSRQQQNGIQRSTQLMRHIGQKFRLVAGAQGQFLGLCLYFQVPFHNQFVSFFQHPASFFQFLVGLQHLPAAPAVLLPMPAAFRPGFRARR